MSEKGETEEGITLLRKALALDPDNAEAKSILNQLMAKKKIDIAKEKNLYKKMLGANQAVENQATSPIGEVMYSIKMYSFILTHTEVLLLHLNILVNLLFQFIVSKLSLSGYSSCYTSEINLPILIRNRL